MVLDAGLATGHADSYVDLLAEVLGQLEDLKDKNNQLETIISLSGGERVTEPEENKKQDAVTFFQWWWNQPGSNTEQGYDQWIESKKDH